MTSDFFPNGDFTEDISKQMRVPDRIMAHNAGSWNNTVSHDQMDVYNMRVPDRILLAGSDQHMSQKSTPRELDLDIGPLPPTSEHIRVNTPPRSIKLDEISYPAAEDNKPPSPQEKGDFISNLSHGNKVLNVKGQDRAVNFEGDNSLVARDLSFSVGDNLSSLDEVQLMRRQIAKLNHRLMAVELENQQQQQREMVLTIAVSAYFLVKALLWINKNV